MAGIVPLGETSVQTAVPVPVDIVLVNAVYVVPSELVSITSSEPLDAVVVFNMPKLNDRLV